MSPLVGLVLPHARRIPLAWPAEVSAFHYRNRRRGTPAGHCVAKNGTNRRTSLQHWQSKRRHSGLDDCSEWSIVSGATKWRNDVAPGERWLALQAERNPGTTEQRRWATSNRFANPKMDAESQPPIPPTPTTGESAPYVMPAFQPVATRVDSKGLQINRSSPAASFS
jgi:hypothetical protein